MLCPVCIKLLPKKFNKNKIYDMYKILYKILLNLNYQDDVEYIIP
jgi:hypothetical protein